MGSLIKEIRQAARSLSKSPTFTIAAIATLGLGIGASTAIFSVTNAVLLRPLPYADGSELVTVWGELRNRNLKDFPMSPGDFPEVGERVKSFESVAGLWTFRQAVSAGDGPPEVIYGAGGTANVFQVLGARIVLGRGFIPDDVIPQPPRPQPPPGVRPPAQPPGPPSLPTIVVLSHEFWERRFGGDSTIVGKTITLNGNNTAQVVGVLEPGFELLFRPSTNVARRPELWTAARIDFPSANRSNVFLRVVARLKPGATIAQAQGELEVLTADLRERFPIKKTAGTYFNAESMHADLVAEVRPVIRALMGGVLFVLLIACANVANLLLVRAAGRERDLATRVAMGATQWQLVRQMLTESLLLGTGGAIIGVVLTVFGIGLLVRFGPADLPRLDDVRVDSFVLSFAAGTGLVAAAISGIVPAFLAARPGAGEILRAGGAAGQRLGRMVSNTVVVAEVALSLVLLVGSGLMAKSFLALQRVDPGYEPKGLLTFMISNWQTQGPEARAAAIQDMRARLGAIPGVTAVSAGGPFPLDGRSGNARWGTAEALIDPTRFQQADVHFVQPGYFETLRTRLIEGRTFTEADNVREGNPLIIDNVLARKAFGSEPAAGKRLLARIRGDTAEWYDVIGVVAHQRHATLAADGREAVFFADGHTGFGAADRWAIRTNGDPLQLGPSVRAVVASVSPLMIVSELQPMSVLVERAQAQTRFAFLLIGIFGAVAAVLAAVGIYGVLSTAVSLRTAEIGVRMAFGAQPANVLRLIVGHGLRVGGIGIGIGLVAAFALTRAMRSMLVEVAPTDPATFVTIAISFALVAAVASWLPALRASRLDPLVALRSE